MNLRPFVAPSLLALAACAAPDGGAPADAPPNARSTQGFVTECPTRTAVWVNPNRGKPCPPAPDLAPGDNKVWVGAPAFDAGNPFATTYCKYTWNDPQTPPDFDELKDALNPDQLPGRDPDPDCPAVASLSSPAEPTDVPAIWQPLRDQAWRHASRPPRVPAPKDLLRVAVIDTSATPYEAKAPATYDAADEHGRLVGRVIGDLACPGAFEAGAGCAIQIVNYPALTRKDERSAPSWNAGPPDGGFYGSLSELAEAIEHALDDWNLARSRPGGPPRLVINLSVGWSPVFGGELVTKPGQAVDPTKLRPSARPVYDAIARASCAGALVVAAAGNHDLSTGAGLVYPAAWESVPAPNADLCSKLYRLPAPQGTTLLPVFPPPTVGAYRPLVYAAGLVDERDQPVGISRKHGQPRLAAYGVGVVTDEPRTGGATRVKTGTSLSAAVTTGAAALAWSYQARLRPDEIMQLVYDTGQTVAPKADVLPDVCGGGACTPWPVRRVSACNAAARAFCGAASCDAFPCHTVPAFAGKPAEPLMDWPAVGLAVEEVSSPGACAGLDACTSWGGNTSHAEPWVGPQPGGGGCSTCAYSTAGGKIVIGLDPYARSCAYAVSASVETAAGTQVFSIQAPSAPIAAELAPLSPLAGPAPPPFQHGLFSLPLPLNPAEVRSVTLWFHTDDGAHPGGAYTRAEGIPIVR